MSKNANVIVLKEAFVALQIAPQANKSVQNFHFHVKNK